MLEFLLIPLGGAGLWAWGGLASLFVGVTALDAVYTAIARTSDRALIHGLAVGTLASTLVYLTEASFGAAIVEILGVMLIVQYLLAPLFGFTTLPDGKATKERAAFEDHGLRGAGMWFGNYKRSLGEGALGMVQRYIPKPWRSVVLDRY